MPQTTAPPIVVAAPLVDAHIHPDKSSWGGPWLSRDRADTLRDFIDNDVRTQAAYTRSVEDRALALFRTAAGQGTRAMRAHVDVGPACGVANVHGVRAAADRLRGVLDVEIVAFPQQGLLTAPGTFDLLDAALGEGADVVGGIDPEGLEGDVDGHLDAVFGLAAKHGADVDIHLHDGGDAGLDQTRRIAARATAEGMGPRVTVSHAFAVAAATGDALTSIADDVAAAGIWLVTCALGGDPVLPVRFLRERGVNVAVGSDGVRDAWTPFGSGSMLDRAHLLSYRTDAMTDADLELAYDACSTAGAKLLRITTDPSGDRIEYPGECLAQVVIDRPTPIRVLRDGDEIARDGVLVS
ncbi:amidohydrolase family protein [Mycolicibacterium obuense]|uniref:Cytosine deaminase n=1 Tax=Mycolicibacterium obuense TaxID=1807 RepID=A0A0J6VF47_9MYCO|nr:amidohydrolase family protein [Mycolicibacterium obuense]KKF03328.1 cytosine deaminase [Mycolicibacterium obuense]KMO68874.1 N-isopropylammelide isopropyl amidohydrolase [Mycolicibacterium obuense]